MKQESCACKKTTVFSNNRLIITAQGNQRSGHFPTMCWEELPNGKTTYYYVDYVLNDV